MNTIGPRLPVQAQPQRDWTVLVWSACDNDLYECCINDLDKAERGLSPNIQVLAQVDHGSNPNPQGPKSMQRLVLEKNDQPLLNSPVVEDFGDGDTADPKKLADFIKWGIEKYPAKNYWLVISDHGDAWRGACRDDSQGSWMSLPQIQQALGEARQATGRKLDLVSFDCCHMASSEVAHQLQNEANYMVGSEEVMGFIGLPYDTMLPKIEGKDARQVAQMLVEESKAHPEDIPTFSAMDLTQVPAFSQSVKELGQAVSASQLRKDQLLAVVNQTQGFDSGYYRDVVDLARNLSQADPSLSQQARRVEESARQLVISQQHAETHPGAHGLNIEVFRDAPETRQNRYGDGATPNRHPEWRTESGSYAETAFARDTGWDQVIARIDTPPPE
ncbi:hypothetical protein JST97_32865 [bacterium]|nr:hypothetical protein [bacterium]